MKGVAETKEYIEMDEIILSIEGRETWYSVVVMINCFRYF